MNHILTSKALREAIADSAEHAADRICDCSAGAGESWESMPEDRWPKAQMREIGTLRDEDVVDPTFEERHPHGTRYGDVDAPVAVKFFPYNRCDLWLCGRCERHVLRYTEFGGYYVDHRIRLLNAKLIID